MASVFLSPSTQEWNPYLTGGNEEEYMNFVVDGMEPYLKESGIFFGRNDRTKTVTEAIILSNAAPYDLHLALHTNASPESRAGQMRGIEIYYAPGSEAGEAFASILQEEFALIYPLEGGVRKIPTTSLAEVQRTVAPAVLVEAGYHDNVEDEAWIKANIDSIGHAAARAIARYVSVPLMTPLQGPLTPMETKEEQAT